MMKKLKRTNPSKKKRTKRLTPKISPEKKREIQEKLKYIKNSIRILFFNINTSIKKKRDRYRLKKKERKNESKGIKIP